MNDIIKLENIEEKIIEINGINVLLDSDVPQLYGAETKRINKAIKNNPEKFPAGYIISLDKKEWESLRSNFSTLEKKGKGKHRKYAPKAFTEKGLYMLATILKSKTATQTTLAIIETFAKIRELTRTMKTLSANPKKETQKKLMKKSGEIMADLLDDGLTASESETSIELNFAVLKFKHTIKKK